MTFINPYFSIPQKTSTTKLKLPHFYAKVTNQNTFECISKNSTIFRWQCHFHHKNEAFEFNFSQENTRRYISPKII